MEVEIVNAKERQEILPTGLDTLPEELIEIIFEQLDRSDMLTFRTLCRSIQRKSFHSFSHTFFDEVRVVLTRPGLRRLLDVANDDRFAPCVSCLSVNMAIMQQNISESVVLRRSRWKLVAYSEQMADQKHLLTLELESAVYPKFMEVLKKFINCRAVNMSFHTSGYAIRLIERSCGKLDHAFSSAHQTTMDSIFRLLWYACTESEARITKFEVAGGSIGENLSYSAFHFPQARISDLSTTLNALEELQLRIGPVSALFSYKPLIPRFLSSASKLRRLHLDLGDHLFTSGRLADPFLEGWFAEPEICMPPLTALWLKGGNFVVQNTLIRFLRLLRDSLTVLHLLNLELHGDWKSVLTVSRFFAPIATCKI